jgi:ribosomal protein S18 acetylase RimI-like enzyme
MVRSFGISSVDSYVLERDLDEPIPDIRPKVPVRISVLTDASRAQEIGNARLWELYMDRMWSKLSRARYARRIQARAAEFERRLKAGEVAVVAELDSKIVGAEWFCLGGEKDDPVVDLNEAIGPGEAYLYQAQVDAEHRGKGIYSKMIADGLLYLKGRGVRTVKVHVEDDNPPSINAAKNLGFKPVRLIKYRRLFSRRRHEVEQLGGPSSPNKEEGR